jgi:ubiquitin-like protein Pup
MAEQEHVRKPADRQNERGAQPAEARAESANADRADKLKADLDDLLDEIDEVLEENAEEFVRNYVQKGGE